MPRAQEPPGNAIERRIEEWVAGNLDTPTGEGSSAAEGWRERIAEPPALLQLRPGATRDRPAAPPNNGGWRRLSITERRGITVVRLRDKSLVKEPDVREVAEELSDLIEAGRRRLALDFGAVERISSLMSPVLAEAARRCSAEGVGLLKLFRLRPEIAGVVALAAPGGALAVVPNEAAAIDGPWPESDAPRPLPDALIGALAASRKPEVSSAAASAGPADPPPDPGASRPRLIVMTGPLAGRSVPIGRGEIILGRDAGCRLQLASAQVSRRHASLRITPEGHARARDLGSTNGTFLNGNRLGEGEREVRPGDSLQVGPFTFTFAVADGPPPAEEAILGWLGLDRAPEESPAAESDTAMEMAAHAPPLRREVLGDALVVTPFEPQLIEERTVGALRDELQSLLEAPLPRRVVVNLEHVARLGSAGVGMLAALHLRLDRMGGALRLCGANARVGLMLEQIRLTALLDLHPNVEEAVLSAWGPPGAEDDPAPSPSLAF